MDFTGTTMRIAYSRARTPKWTPAIIPAKCLLVPHSLIILFRIMVQEAAHAGLEDCPE